MQREKLDFLVAVGEKLCNVDASNSDMQRLVSECANEYNVCEFEYVKASRNPTYSPFQPNTEMQMISPANELGFLPFMSPGILGLGHISPARSFAGGPHGRVGQRQNGEEPRVGRRRPRGVRRHDCGNGAGFREYERK